METMPRILFFSSFFSSDSSSVRALFSCDVSSCAMTSRQIATASFPGGELLDPCREDFRSSGKFYMEGHHCIVGCIGWVTPGLLYTCSEVRHKGPVNLKFKCWWSGYVFL
jgi:hypothetical protein